MKNNIIIQGDCLEEMKKLPENSVDAIITDPPYFNQGTKPKYSRKGKKDVITDFGEWDKFKTDEDYLGWMKLVICELCRVLKEDGSGQPVIQINPSKESGGKQPYQQNRIYDKEGLSPALPSELGGDRSHLIAQALQTDGQLRQGSSWGTDKPQSSRNIRRLTPIECQRLQGFPDDFYDGIEMSDTQKYKQMGNAVTTNVIKAISEKLILS